jgi:transcriptional regulator NrdR family protein
MKCPYCKTQSIVLKTRYRKDRATMRRRICKVGHRFTTEQRLGAPREVLFSRPMSRRER